LVLAGEAVVDRHDIASPVAGRTSISLVGDLGIAGAT
jgi:hypothetical protein